MIKKLSLHFLFLPIFIFAQKSIFWEVSDPSLNSKFIESYINRLIEADKFENNSIQASHSIIVQMDVINGKKELKKLKAKNAQMGEYQSFDMEEVGKMDQTLVQKVSSRKYKWKDVSRRDLSELEQFSTVDNIFQERSFKDARDAFWWSNAQISASTAMRVFIRQKSGSLALRVEQGFPDMGISRHLSENLILGLSNDVVSTYLIVPGNTETVLKGIGHPIEGNFGFGFKFDTHTLGGQVNYMDINAIEYDYPKVFSRKHVISPSSSGLLYWSNTFQINRKIDSDYGSKIKDQKKKKEKAGKEISSSRFWSENEESYKGLFISENDGVAKIKIDKDEAAQKAAEKGRDWTTKDGSVVKAKLAERGEYTVILVRNSDEREFSQKISDLSQKDQDFISRLEWDGEKTKDVLLENLSSEDQQLIRTATGSVKARSGRGRELKVVKPFASMRLKAGLSFVQFVHGRLDTANNLSITDRVSGTNSIGFYVKVEGVTDTKNTKAYAQLNASGSGFKAILFGAEHNIWRMVNVGLEFSLYPNNSFIDFQDDRRDPNSKWKWYPGKSPNEKEEGGGSFMIAPYITVNF